MPIMVGIHEAGFMGKLSKATVGQEEGAGEEGVMFILLCN